MIVYKILLLQHLFLFDTRVTCNKDVCGIVHGTAIEMYIFCDVTLLQFFSLLCTLLSMVVYGYDSAL